VVPLAQAFGEKRVIARRFAIRSDAVATLL
jgi:hypothetical protein